VATKIRLRRMGRKKRPFYRIVVIDSRSARNGKYIEALGHYDPLQRPAEIKLDESKAIEWLKKGAIPSDTVRNIFQKEGVALKWHLMRMGANEDTVHEEMQKFEMLRESKKEKVKATKAVKKAQASKEDTSPAPEEAKAEESTDQPD